MGDDKGTQEAARERMYEEHQRGHTPGEAEQAERPPCISTRKAISDKVRANKPEMQA